MVRGIEFGEGIVGPELSRAHRQVLAFVGAYLHGYDCLPSTAEVAEGCGLRSSRRAARLLHDLESLGILVRDPRYNRLGELRRSVGTSPIDEHHQLWLCELGLIEVACVLEAIRRALAFAPDAATLGEIHTDGVQRAAELQAYEGARRRLADVGASLHADDIAALEGQRRVVTAAYKLASDWSAYCIVRLVWSLSAFDWLSGIDPFSFGYVGTSFVVSHRAFTTLLPTYRSRASGPLISDERAPAIVERLAALLGEFRSGMAHHAAPKPPPPFVDVAALLAETVTG